MAGTKVCIKCGLEKAITEFGFSGYGNRYRRNACYQCERIEKNAYYYKNRQTVILRNTAWAKRHPELRAKYGKTAYRRSKATLKGYVTLMLNVIKSRCKKSKMPFSIVLDDVLAIYKRQDGRCVLTGRNLVIGGDGNGRVRSVHRDALSFDRIEPSKGYIPENIRLVTHQANMARSYYSDAELVQFCRDVLRHAGDLMSDPRTPEREPPPPPQPAEPVPAQEPPPPGETGPNEPPQRH